MKINGVFYKFEIRKALGFGAQTLADLQKNIETRMGLKLDDTQLLEGLSKMKEVRLNQSTREYSLTAF